MTRPLGRSSRRSIILGIAAATVLAALPLLADAPPGPYFNGFETSLSSWFDSGGTIARQPSGYVSASGYASGISSATGSYHARLGLDPGPVTCQSGSGPHLIFGGPFTRWGGYSETFPTGGYRTSVKIYLDVPYAQTHLDTRFDWASVINYTDGTFLREFVFNVGTDATGFVITAGNNASRCDADPYSNGADHAPKVSIATSGWYTFEHRFLDNNGVLQVIMRIIDSNNLVVGSWTRSDPSDVIGIVGGNRYGGFEQNEFPDLAIDDSQRTGLNLAASPTTATNLVSTTHTVFASVTSSDANNHPAPGPSVTVEFDVINGPNAGQTSHPANTGTCSSMNCATDATGHVYWTYLSNGAAGTDTIQVCFTERPDDVHRDLDEARTCKTVTKTWTRQSIPHDVDVTLTPPSDIALGSDGIQISDVKVACKNETAAENVRCTLQVIGLPTQCTAQSSGHDKAFGTGDDGTPAAGGSPIFLLDNTQLYKKGETKAFDFKLKTSCSPNLPKQPAVTLTFKACSDGGDIDPANPCTDVDLTPDPSPNVMSKTAKLHQ
jgi:hypothetical protein